MGHGRRINNSHAYQGQYGSQSRNEGKSQPRGQPVGQ